jgi:hypothetical protein
MATATFVSAQAQQSTPKPPPPPHQVFVPPTAAQQRFRQAVQQSQVRDQLQKNQVEHQLRQQAIELGRTKQGSTTPNDKQTDKAEQAQDELYDAQQRDRLQRYSDAVMAQPVPQSSSSSGKKDAGH